MHPAGLNISNNGKRLALLGHSLHFILAGDVNGGITMKCVKSIFAFTLVASMGLGLAACSASSGMAADTAAAEPVAEQSGAIELPAAEVPAAKEVREVPAKLNKEQAAQEAEEKGSKGGTALTVLAVVVAILLVVLLAVILVLNFAPDSAIALKVDSIIETITSYFSAVDVTGTFLL